MRKLVCLLLAAASLSMSAQNSTSPNYKSPEKVNHSGLFVETAVGPFVGDCDTGLGWAVNLGYRWNFYDGFSWDAIKVGFNTDVLHFSDLMSLRFLTGFRYNSPQILAGKSIYGNFGIGYQFLTQATSASGVAYEIGVGVNLTPLVSLGIVWEGDHASQKYYWNFYEIKQTANWGLFGVKLGINF